MQKDEGYLLDMLTEAKKLQERFDAVTLDQFEASEDLQYVSFWSIAIIGEAASKVTTEFRDAHPRVPWRIIVGMRNFLIHNYAAIDAGKVWTAIQVSIPELITALEPIVPPDTP
jgi:uncharacterized protein with HEPN domain